MIQHLCGPLPRRLGQVLRVAQVEGMARGNLADPTPRFFDLAKGYRHPDAFERVRDCANNAADLSEAGRERTVNLLLDRASLT